MPVVVCSVKDGLALSTARQGGQTLSGLAETPVRESNERRRARAEFIARSMALRADAMRTGACFAADLAHAELGQMLV